MVTILISATFRGAVFIRGEALISMWAPKRAALIRGRPLFETQRLIEEIRYTILYYIYKPETLYFSNSSHVKYFFQLHNLAYR